MTLLLASSSNDSLTALAEILHAGENTLGNLWTDQLHSRASDDLRIFFFPSCASVALARSSHLVVLMNELRTSDDLRKANAILPGITSQYQPASQEQRACYPTIVAPSLLEGTIVNFPRSLVRLAWILQHATTLLPMANDLQATLNSETAGVANLHAWGLVLPSSSRVNPVTYHSVVAVRYPMLCRLVDDVWELGSFASGGLPNRPPGFQLVLWDTNPRLNGLVAADLDAVVSRLTPNFPAHVGYADGLFVMTTATEHKNNLNRKNNPRSLRVETIANSAGGTAQVALVVQPSIGFLNGRFNWDGHPRRIQKTA